MENQKTKEDLKNIHGFEAQIREALHAIRKIKEACPHLDYKVEIVETLAFDCTPKRVCLVCSKWLDGITEEEQKAVVSQWHLDMHETAITDEELTERYKGWNFP